MGALVPANIEDLLRERAERLKSDIEDTKAILDAIERLRYQLDTVSDELRWVTTITKERTAWLITELDKLKAEVAKIRSVPVVLS
jgi:predicted GTPase